MFMHIHEPAMGQYIQFTSLPILKIAINKQSYRLYFSEFFDLLVQKQCQSKRLELMVLSFQIIYIPKDKSTL